MSKKTWKDADKSILKHLPSPEGNRPYELKMKQPELTFMGVHEQPDFATIEINYIPNVLVVELKSLKLYIHGFRNVGVFHEAVTNKIMDDFRLACSPRKIDVVGHFNPRGGISTVVDVGWLE